MIARESPYIWVTWLTGLLVGENSCEWAAWFKAHYKDYEKMPTDFDQPAWMIQHTALLRRLQKQLGKTGLKLSVEAQNWFSLRGKEATLGGKPDVIGVDKNQGTIYEAKTGSPRASHRAQVMIYMWAAPRALPQFKDTTFDGRLVYDDHEEEVPEESVDARFITAMKEQIGRVAAPEPPPRTPSSNECRYCEITLTDCNERIQDAGSVESVTDEF